MFVIGALSAALLSNPTSAANCSSLTAEQLLHRVGRTGDGGIAAMAAGDRVITDYDLAQRVALHVALTGANPDAEQLKRIEAADLQDLKDDAALFAVAQKKNVVVSSQEVDTALAGMLAHARVSKGQLNSLLSRAGVTVDYFRAQVAIDLVRRKMNTQVGGLRYRLVNAPCLRTG
jgi:hypothetical protein